MWRRLLIILSLGALAGVILIPLNPVNSTLFKLAFLVAVAGFWLGPLILFWKVRAVRWCLLLLPILRAIPFLLPARPVRTAELRADYTRRMKSFEGTRYFWGGEGVTGIDCSGLPRKAWRDALLAEGIRRLDGGLLRACLEQWWYDATADALSQGHRNYTAPLETKGAIAQMDYAGLLPGDLAVTSSRSHMLAYAGDGKWIQADPNEGKVLTLDGRTGDSGWFQVPVTTYRWRLLTE